ncbi:MAG TPA: MBL fold metallo-hydrolase [Gaiellaceae bacterium]|jgi:glyoxylase-like metal-dependent hydrolase (beta-lactamase superfamily II)|nr:MBL fold metallo-hydrolase [Gaiellaceae bacterium]
MTAAAGPVVREGAAEHIADHVYLIPDGRVPLVPNVGIVVGEDACLVVDTGMGIENGERVLREARRLAGGRPLYLTLTHFHAEHGYGAQVFESEATIVYNRKQADELLERGQGMLEMFAGRDANLARLLEGVEFVRPHETYEGRQTLDLGGVQAELIEIGHAHTFSDQVVWIAEDRVLFAGDLFEYRFFPIVPNPDVHIANWIAALERLAAMEPDVVVPGHGERTGAAELLEPRDYFREVAKRVAALRAAGKSVEETQDELEPEVAAKWSHWDGPIWIRNTIANCYEQGA